MADVRHPYPLMVPDAENPLTEVARAIEACSLQDRNRLARFSAGLVEEKGTTRHGAGLLFAWVGVAAAGRTPKEVDLHDISVEDRRYVSEVASSLANVVRDETAIQNARTPADLGGKEAQPHPAEEVWLRLRSVIERSLDEA